MSSRQIKGGLVLSYLSIFLSNVIGITYTPFMLRKMGQSDYGLYMLGATIISYMALMDFGFGAAIIRYTSLYRAKKEEDKLSSLYGLFLIIYSVIGLLCLIIGYFLYENSEFFFSQSFNETELYKMKIITLIVVVYLSVCFPLNLFGAIIISHEKFIFMKVANLIKTLLVPLLMIPLLLNGNKSIAMTAVIAILGLALNLVNAFFCFYKLSVKISFRNLERAIILSILSFSVLVFLKNVFERIYWSSGQLILGTMLGTVAVAIFSLAIQLKGYYEIFSKTISGLFLPRVTVILNNQDKGIHEFNALFIKVSRLQFHIIYFILIVFILVGKNFIILWAGKDYVSAYHITLMIMIAYTIPLAQSLGGLLLQALNKLSMEVAIFFVAALLSVGLTILFVGVYGTTGAALALICAIGIGEGILLNYYWYRLGVNIKLFFEEILKISIPGTIFLSILFWIVRYIAIDSIAELVIYAAIICIVYIPFIYLTGMNSYEKSLCLTIIRKLRSLK